MMNVVELIKDHEGLMLKPYQCSANKTTIGYGRNLEDSGITLEEAEFLLANDIRHAKTMLHLSYSWFSQLDEVRQAAMVDLIYNLGSARLSGFREFLAAMHRGDYERAGDELVDSRWFGQVGRRGPRIVSMVRTGRWPE